ncbi:hypothetical protein PIB30_071421 [Stylosanthes scabra]|uniref:Uncharacterized protein n=1 Tax=Stylosanthes scabra TaxID=79078 RepID=A0ABU6RNP6_9FABA|nr:hypothetical protein [Stylosanthes scabra]
MKDMFLGTEEEEDREEDQENKKRYYDEFGFDDSRRSNSARLTQGWLEEARHVLASSSPNSSNSSRKQGGSVVGSPRFAASSSSSQGRNNVPLLMSLDRRDPLSRSARRNKGGENLGDEILSKSSSKHTPNSFTSPSSSPSSHDHGHGHGFNSIDPLCRRKSRFQSQTLNPNTTNSNLIQTPLHKSSSNLPPPNRNNQIQYGSSSSFSSDSLDNAKDSIINQTLYQPTSPEAYEVSKIFEVEAKLISPPSTSPDAKSKSKSKTELQGFRGKSKFFFARWFGFGS